MRILNLYAGIGGNRKLWGDEHEITAVEYDPKIAAAYRHFWPNDELIVGDAHEYLLHNYMNFDFIWTSPPCQSHSQMRQYMGVTSGQVKPKYPDMKLYEEIIFLQANFKGLYIVENVKPYYEPLIRPTAILQRHPVWANFAIERIDLPSDNIEWGTVAGWQESTGFDLTGFDVDKRTVLRNCVSPILGLHILNAALGKTPKGEQMLFDMEASQ
jgi:DNA (cytosine-5)-methyltransferase 1